MKIPKQVIGAPGEPADLGKRSTSVTKSDWLDAAGKSRSKDLAEENLEAFKERARRRPGAPLRLRRLRAADGGLRGDDHGDLDAVGTVVCRARRSQVRRTRSGRRHLVPCHRAARASPSGGGR